MPTRTFSALSKDAERPLTVECFKPDLREFQTIPWTWLRENELNLLSEVRKFMPDASIARRGDGGIFVISQTDSLAFESPALELPETISIGVEQENLQSA